MPRLSLQFPKYRLHRASGQAVVTLSGHDLYLGPYGTKTSRLAYDRAIAEWLAADRQFRPASSGETSREKTVVEVFAAYKRFAEGYYRKQGAVTNEAVQIVVAMRVASDLYGREPVSQFGPLKLQAVQQAMIERNWSRKHINKQISRLIRALSWGTAQEMVPAGVVQALREVPSLHKNRTRARETEPVRPVASEVVAATLPHLPPVVADMVRLQRLTAGRPEDICRLRPCDLNQAGTVWRYYPETHKTEHQGRPRVILIGPQAQEILTPYLRRAATEYCFSPAESELERRDEKHRRRKTPLGYGNRPGTNRRSQPTRRPSAQYSTASYRRAIQRGCELAFAMPKHLRLIPASLPDAEKQRLRQEAAAWRRKYVWSPNQVRHLAATEIRSQFGLEAAQILLGHAAADVTQVYAERDLARGVEIMGQIG